MENLVEELKKVVRFKEETEAGDIVLVAIDTPRSLLYARIRGFEKDDSRKDEWWLVSMQLLTVPLQEVVWTLRREQFTGQEIFTMGGEKRFFQAVVIGREPSAAGESNKGRKTTPQKGSLKRWNSVQSLYVAQCFPLVQNWLNWGHSRRWR